jgi:hypothetical protein
MNSFDRAEPSLSKTEKLSSVEVDDTTYRWGDAEPGTLLPLRQETSSGTERSSAIGFGVRKLEIPMRHRLPAGQVNTISGENGAFNITSSA